MALVCQVRDAKNGVISELKFNATGRSKGWQDNLENCQFERRASPLYIPREGRSLYMEMRSGSPDTEGFFAIKNLQVDPGVSTPTTLWANGELGLGIALDTPEGTPRRWTRRGLDRGIPRIILHEDKVALVLADESKETSAEWASLQPFEADLFAGKTVILSWEEAYRVSGGHVYRASYLNVPPGDYTFRVIGMTPLPSLSTASLELAVRISPPFWERAWFLPLIVASVIGVSALWLVRAGQLRTQLRMRELRFQNDLERDRARIARDMHDDLGTRISVLSLHGAQALTDLDENPANTRRLLSEMKTTSREIVVAMDDLVWAVDPAYDNLDQFGTYLTPLTEELFRESAIRCRLDIPALLPAYPLSSDVRYQLALAVKEALHNILRHAGQCEVRLLLRIRGNDLLIQIQDSGCGFHERAASERHGLKNLMQRLHELGGTCHLKSTLGEGTLVEFLCPLLDGGVPSSKS